jgi:hypothetical protein
MLATRRSARHLGYHLAPRSPLPMGLGTKNRQKQTADICKQHLRDKYRDKLGLVEEFIVEIEGAPKNCDATCWGQFGCRRMGLHHHASLQL